MIIIFPKIAVPSYKESGVMLEKSFIATQMENGIVLTRRRFTKERETWELKWNALIQDEYETLMDFIKNTVHYGAISFSWENPWNSKTYTVRIVEVSKWNIIGGAKCDYWTGSITLQEV